MRAYPLGPDAVKDAIDDLDAIARRHGLLLELHTRPMRGPHTLAASPAKLNASGRMCSVPVRRGPRGLVQAAIDLARKIQEVPA